MEDGVLHGTHLSCSQQYRSGIREASRVVDGPMDYRCRKMQMHDEDILPRYVGRTRCGCR